MRDKSKKLKLLHYPALEEFLDTKDVKVVELSEPSQTVLGTLLGKSRVLVVVKKNGKTVRGIVPAECLRDEILMKEKLAPLKELLERVRE